MNHAFNQTEQIFTQAYSQKLYCTYMNHIDYIIISNNTMSCLSGH